MIPEKKKLHFLLLLAMFCVLTGSSLVEAATVVHYVPSLYSDLQHKRQEAHHKRQEAHNALAQSLRKLLNKEKGTQNYTKFSGGDKIRFQKSVDDVIALLAESRKKERESSRGVMNELGGIYSGVKRRVLGIEQTPFSENKPQENVSGLIDRMKNKLNEVKRLMAEVEWENLRKKEEKLLEKNRLWSRFGSVAPKLPGREERAPAGASSAVVSSAVASSGNKADGFNFDKASKGIKSFSKNVKSFFNKRYADAKKVGFLPIALVPPSRWDRAKAWWTDTYGQTGLQNYVPASVAGLGLLAGGAGLGAWGAYRLGKNYLQQRELDRLAREEEDADVDEALLKGEE